jgi:dihydroorotate dehydrogenase
MYAALRNILFRYDAEAVHSFAMHRLQNACAIPPLKSILEKSFVPRPLPVRVFGLEFRNPIGLAAGFDKNASYLRELDVLGFGHVEIGTVTPLPQQGNDKPRLFRLPADRALINRMGFNNAGMDLIKTNIAKWRNDHPNSKMIIGGNIGKNKLTENEDAASDYIKCFESLHEVVDYFVVNVSSPNTPGLRELQERPALEKIFGALQSKNQTMPRQKPILLKIAPDLSLLQLDEIANLALEMKLDGLVATNTTISRQGLVTNKSIVEEIGAGGLSGKPVQERSTEVLRYLHQKTGGKIPLIGSGGVFTAHDATQKISAGARLVQVWTGFIYEGPAIVKNICNGLR